jgi:dolichol kinase
MGSSWLKESLMRQESHPFSVSTSPLPRAEDDDSVYPAPTLLPDEKSTLSGRPTSVRVRAKANSFEMRIELTRKSLHLLIAFTPILMLISKTFTLAILIAGTFSYIVFEFLRMKGVRVPIVTWLTVRAARIRDDGRFVVGPVTLGLGAFLSVLLFEHVEATIAIYALAFGDGFSSLIGKGFGRIPMPFSDGKSLEGTITCLSLTFLASYLVTKSFGISLTIALSTAFVEMLPLKDFDNIAIPLAAGFVASLLL